MLPEQTYSSLKDSLQKFKVWKKENRGLLGSFGNIEGSVVKEERKF